MSKFNWLRVFTVLLLAWMVSSLLSHPIMNREAFGLEGPVKVYVSRGDAVDPGHYYFDRDGNLISYWSEDDPERGTSADPIVYSYEYDAQGRIIQVNKKRSNTGLFPQAVLSYHDNGEMHSVKEYMFDCCFNLAKSFTITWYDKSGRKTALEKYNNSEDLYYRQRFTYDEAGRQTKIEHYDGHDNLTSREDFTYDSKGWLLSERYDDLKRGKESSITTYDYYETGHLQKKEKKQGDDSDIVSYFYNEDGLAIQERCWVVYANDANNWDILNEYDDNGRITKVVKTNGTPMVILTCSYDSYGNTIEESGSWYDSEFEYEYYE